MHHFDLNRRTNNDNGADDNNNAADDNDNAADDNNNAAAGTTNKYTNKYVDLCIPTEIDDNTGVVATSVVDKRGLGGGDHPSPFHIELHKKGSESAIANTAAKSTWGNVNSTVNPLIKHAYTTITYFVI